ncbi:hypothetical protein SAMD00023353_1001890 [Rosellinia necatrix]|uniref:Uncharacterized protein n=1 Tax=Rosellinia necatrix TaxID=77044 RepID=A0A1S8A6K8_ROSNE|nr:hypothetical protein SAMD00023353_1001890 [Rosellinia necatrix]
MVTGVQLERPVGNRTLTNPASTHLFHPRICTAILLRIWLPGYFNGARDIIWILSDCVPLGATMDPRLRGGYGSNVTLSVASHLTITNPISLVRSKHSSLEGTLNIQEFHLTFHQSTNLIQNCSWSRFASSRPRPPAHPYGRPITTKSIPLAAVRLLSYYTEPTKSIDLQPIPK